MDISFCIGINTQPKKPESDDNFEIVISFDASIQFLVDRILRDYYRRISMIKLSKISESTYDIYGRIRNINQRGYGKLFKRIYIRKSNIKKEKMLMSQLKTILN